MKKVLTILYLIISFDINAQKKFNVNIIFPENININNTIIAYENGRENRFIITSPVFHDNQTVLEGEFFSIAATIKICYQNEKLKCNRYWVTDKPATLDFTKKSNTDIKKTLFEHERLTNIYNLNDKGEKLYKNFIDIENRDLDSFYEKSKLDMGVNDSLKILFNEKQKELNEKKIKFILKYKKLYYSFWLFRREIVYNDYNIPKLAKIYNSFPKKFRQSFEGKEIEKKLVGRLLKKGSIAPIFESMDINHDTISLKKINSKFILLVFWASWCKPCIQEIPIIKSIRERFTQNQIEIISISMDTDSEKYLSIIKKYEMKWIHIFGNPEISNIYGMISIPTIFLIDNTGKIIYSIEEESDLDNKLPILNKILSKQLLDVSF